MSFQKFILVFGALLFRLFLYSQTLQKTRIQDQEQFSGVTGLQSSVFEKISLQEALVKAKIYNKYVFIECNTTWCGPCRMMDRNTFVNDTVISYLRENFISVRMQMDTSKNDNSEIKSRYEDADRLQKRFGIYLYPSFIFLSSNGEIKHRDFGYKSPRDFINVLSDALDSNKQYYSLLRRYGNGEVLSIESIKRLVNTASQLHEEEIAHRIANSFINKISSKDIFTWDNLLFIYRNTNNSKDRGFNFFKDSAEFISAAIPEMTKENCYGLVEKIIYSEEIKPFEQIESGRPNWEIIKKNVRKYDSLGERSYKRFRPGIIFRTELEPELKAGRSWSQILEYINDRKFTYEVDKILPFVIGYFDTYVNQHKDSNCLNLRESTDFYFKRHSIGDRELLFNAAAYTIFQRSLNRVDLITALSWIKPIMDIKKNSQFYPEMIDTYANLLYKLGEKESAVIWEEKAEKLRPNQKVFIDVLQKMKNGEPTW